MENSSINNFGFFFICLLNSGLAKYLVFSATILPITSWVAVNYSTQVAISTPILSIEVSFLSVCSDSLYLIYWTRYINSSKFGFYWILCCCKGILSWIYILLPGILNGIIPNTACTFLVFIWVKISYDRLVSQSQTNLLELKKVVPVGQEDDVCSGGGVHLIIKIAIIIIEGWWFVIKSIVKCWMSAAGFTSALNWEAQRLTWLFNMISIQFVLLKISPGCQPTFFWQISPGCKIVFWLISPGCQFVLVNLTRLSSSYLSAA